MYCTQYCSCSSLSSGPEGIRFPLPALIPREQASYLAMLCCHACTAYSNYHDQDLGKINTHQKSFKVLKDKQENSCSGVLVYVLNRLGLSL